MYKFNQEELGKQLCKHRENQNLNQYDAANMVGKSPSTYQRWESSGQCLTDIFSLLRVFEVLNFSTSEIIDVLDLPPLTLDEVKAIYQDEDLLESIKGNAIYSVMRQKCPDVDDFTLKKLLVLLLEECLKRLGSR